MRLRALLIGFAVLLAADCACAQPAYPNRPLHILVGFLAGSPPDVVARKLGASISEASGQPVLVENVTGAGGSLAAERLAKAAPDGYTLAVLTEAQVLVNPKLYALHYRPAEDFSPISQVFQSSNLLVVGSGVPAQSLHDLLAMGRKNPGALTFASGGTGTTAHLAGEMLNSQASVQLRHVPYRGIIAALPDLATGRVTMAFSPAGIVLPQVRDGTLRALAVTAEHRAAFAPDVPTMAELGYPGLAISGWAGLFAPAGTPSKVIDALHAQVVATLAQPAVQRQLAALALDPIGSAPEQFRALIASEEPRWAARLRDAHVTMQ